MTWTQERIDQLTRLWDEGLSCSLIGEEMGITRNAVIGKVHRLNLRPRRTTVRASGWKWLHRPNRSKTRKSRAKPKPAPKVVKMTKPKPEPVAFTTGLWEPLAGSTPVTLEHVTGCRWPVSDPFAPPGSIDLFCNCQPMEGGSYCPEHHARSVGQGTSFERQAPKVAKDTAKREAWVNMGSTAISTRAAMNIARAA